MAFIRVQPLLQKLQPNKDKEKNNLCNVSSVWSGDDKFHDNQVKCHR